MDDKNQSSEEPKAKRGIVRRTPKDYSGSPERHSTYGVCATRGQTVCWRNGVPYNHEGERLMICDPEEDKIIDEMFDEKKESRKGRPLGEGADEANEESSVVSGKTSAQTEKTRKNPVEEDGSKNEEEEKDPEDEEEDDDGLNYDSDLPYTIFDDDREDYY